MGGAPVPPNGSRAWTLAPPQQLRRRAEMILVRAPVWDGAEPPSQVLKLVRGIRVCPELVAYRPGCCIG